MHVYKESVIDMKIGILTSGGDSPGMNNAIAAIVKAGIANGIEVYGIYNGYKGMVEGKIKKLELSDILGIVDKGGTILRTARLPEFKEVAVRQKAIEQLKAFGIEAVVVIGGDGSYMGAMKLSEMGINCIGLPGTIDNDIACTDYTIGFDTCQNTILDAIKYLKDTAASHCRCIICECMGNKCGDLTLFCGIGTDADFILTPDHPVSFDAVVEGVRAKFEKDPDTYSIILLSEKYVNADELRDRINNEVGCPTRICVLGHIQRGGSPTSFDRILSSRMGVKAVELLLEGKGGRCIGIKNNKIVDFDIYEALAMQRITDPDTARLADIL